MPGTLTVRRLDEETIRRLKLRAARHNRSAEAEVREILREALASEPNGEFKVLAEKLRTMTAKRRHTPAEILQRASRSER